jgi:hypothetical protein
MNPLDPARWPGDQDRSVTAPPLDGPVVVLASGTRRFLALATAVCSVVALVHQPLTGALASAHGAGVLGAAHAVLTWPWPLTQPILAGIAAFVLIAIGVQAHGWRQVTRPQRWYLLSFTVAAVLGAGPTVLIVTLTLLVFTLAIGIGLITFLGLLALLIVARR